VKQKTSIEIAIGLITTLQMLSTKYLGAAQGATWK
jgi:hypothetical protein